MGIDKVVGIDEGKIVALGDVEACVASVAESAVLLVDDVDALILHCPFNADSRAGVGRSVVDQNQLVVVKILMNHALDTLFECGLYIVDRYDNR
jgi:hypothetical protein